MVRAESPSLGPEMNSLGQIVSSRHFVNLPLIVRDTYSIVELVPSIRRFAAFMEVLASSQSSATTGNTMAPSTKNKRGELR